MGTENLSTALRALIAGGALTGMACMATFGLLYPSGSSLPRNSVSGPQAETLSLVSASTETSAAAFTSDSLTHSGTATRFPVPQLPSLTATAPEIRQMRNSDRPVRPAVPRIGSPTDGVESDQASGRAVTVASQCEAAERLTRIERQLSQVLRRFHQPEPIPGHAARKHPARIHSSVEPPAAVAAAIRPGQPVNASAAASADEPAVPRISATHLDTTQAGVTVVSERPLRVDVRSRSTTITDLLTEFATATDSDLIISTREDYPVRAVSLSGLTPESLFALLSENQMFEILYESPPGEARRIRLIPHRMISRRIDPRATLPPEKTAPDPDTLSGTIPTDLSRPPDQTDTVESSIGRQQRPGVSSTPLYTRIQSRSTRILVRHPDSQPVPEISSPVTSETKSAPKQSDGQEPPDAQPGRRLVSNSTAANSTAANSTAANSTAAATPASDPATQPVPATDTTAASTPSGPQELSPAADAQTRKQYDIRATVVHLVTTSTAGFEQAGITPIHVPGTRSPSHRTAAQHAVDQAVRLGHVTPVSDASVSITAGQSACLKIGFLCLHCNAEQGLSAGDTLRISVDDTASGHTRVTVQGLTLESSEPLLKPGLFNALLSAPQSFLIAESGTSGSVTVHEKKSALARLPVIGRMLGKSRSRQVRQIAQRLIIVTLIPAEPGLVAEAEATTDQTRLTAARSLPASRSRKNAGQNSPELLPRSLTRSALRASTTGRKPFVLPRFPLPAPVPSSPAATPDTPERLPSVPLNPVREQTPAPEVEAVHTTSRARNS